LAQLEGTGGTQRENKISEPSGDHGVRPIINNIQLHVEGGSAMAISGGTNIRNPDDIRKEFWKYGLCGCCSNPCVCCCGTFCPMCLFRRNLRKLQTDVGTMGCLQCCCGIPMFGPMRSLARERYWIQGTYWEDTVAGFCCPLLVNCQVAGEIAAHGRVRTAYGNTG